MLSRLRHFYLLALVLLAGCSTRIQVAPTPRFATSGERGAVHGGGVWWGEPVCRRVLVRHDLERFIRREPERALQELETIALRSLKEDERAAATLLAYRYAQKLELARSDKALAYYLKAAQLGYCHLSRTDWKSLTNRWDEPICRTYNQAVAGTVTMLQRRPGGLRTNQTVTLAHQMVEVNTRPGTADFHVLDYDQWHPAEGWRQVGFENHYFAEGIGARLVASRTNHLKSSLERHLPDEGVVHPATAVLEFPPSAEAVTNTQLAVTLRLYSPLFTEEFDLAGKPWPLAADYTMPWATLLARSGPLARTKWSSLVHPGETKRPHRLYLMEPYAPDRIPLIMVHGLFSTPLTWKEMTNELLGDPEIRRRYQIWHYLYPTGLSFLTSAAEFREELEDVRKLLDPEDHDYATHNLVVIGHSMGGLLTRTLITDSGEAIWDSLFAKPYAAMDAKDPRIQELQRRFFFTAKPYVKRVIFIAVPHRGSSLADGLFGRIIAGKVRIPADLQLLVSSLRAAIPDLLKPTAEHMFAHGFPTSIGSLSPRANGLIALADLPVKAGIPFHSIIGDRGLGGGPKSSDGVVPYTSSHLEGAASELVVPSGHGAGENPKAIAEVKRILKAHLATATNGQKN